MVKFVSIYVHSWMTYFNILAIEDNITARWVIDVGEEDSNSFRIKEAIESITISLTLCSTMKSSKVESLQGEA